MASKKTSVWGKRRGNVYEAAEPEPKQEWRAPDPANVQDGLPRVIGVYYMEPNPLAPDDRAKDIPRFGWGVYCTDGDGAELIAMRTLDQVMAWARSERAAAYERAGNQIKAIESRVAEIETVPIMRNEG